MEDIFVYLITTIKLSKFEQIFESISSLTKGLRYAIDKEYVHESIMRVQYGKIELDRYFQTWRDFSMHLYRVNKWKRRKCGIYVPTTNESERSIIQLGSLKFGDVVKFDNYKVFYDAALHNIEERDLEKLAISCNYPPAYWSNVMPFKKHNWNLAQIRNNLLFSRTLEVAVTRNNTYSIMITSFMWCYVEYTILHICQLSDNSKYRLCSTDSVLHSILSAKDIEYDPDTFFLQLN